MLNGHLVALNRFISRSTDNCKSFFLVLKKNGADFHWNEESETAFKELRRYLVSPLTVKTYPERDVVSLTPYLEVSSGRTLV